MLQPRHNHICILQLANLDISTLEILSPDKIISLLRFPLGPRNSGIFLGRTSPLWMRSRRQRMEVVMKNSWEQLGEAACPQQHVSIP